MNPANPQTWNRYAYVANNPLLLIDPLGLCGWTICVTVWAPFLNDGFGGGGGGHFAPVLDTEANGGVGSGRRIINKIVNVWHTTVHTVACSVATPLILTAQATGGTVGAGLGASGGFGVVTGVSGSASYAVVADRHGNVGITFSAGGNLGAPAGPGPVYGIGAQAGRQALVSNADTIFDLGGPFIGGSTSFPGNVGASVATSPNGEVTATTFTFGPSLGGRVTTTEVSDTAVPNWTTFNCSDVIP